MCRNIKTLFNYEPSATLEEINAASLQYVRKISGFRKPSKVNKDAFDLAIKEITKSSEKLLESLETSAVKRNRQDELKKQKLKNQKRFS